MKISYLKKVRKLKIGIAHVTAGEKYYEIVSAAKGITSTELA
jgi:hypothetical protein